ncbi:MAG: hypothetical protein FJ161_03905 [Gammaproteobacteria bacterium]|nr:hypothetical protein [Gammaproteobacteria bacterium]
MSGGYSAAFLKMQLMHFQASERFFLAPVDLEQLKSLINQKEEEERSGGQGTTTFSKSYTDFLLPLPEHLQPTEVGIPDPNMIQKRRSEKGMNQPATTQERTSRNELKARNEHKLRNTPKPQMDSAPRPRMQMQRKIKIAPRPGGMTSQQTEEE